MLNTEKADILRRQLRICKDLRRNFQGITKNKIIKKELRKR
jgi:hypothetical protein